MLASTSMSFDLSVFEWFLPLVTGRTVILVDSLFALPQAPARDRVTVRQQRASRRPRAATA